MIVYFSGTGNSRYAAQMLAAKLHDQWIDGTAMIKEGHAAQLSSNLPWVFVAPTYGWQIPHVFADYIREGEFSGSKKAYFVMTCGTDIGNAGMKLRKLCLAKGFEYQGVLQVVMPENYIALFPVTDERESARLIKEAEPVIQGAAEAIIKESPFEKRRIGLMDRGKTSITNPIFYGFFVKAKPFYAAGDCTGCGKCVKKCPLNNIRLVEGKPQWGTVCTHCMACISYCPTEAIEYGKASRGKRRYQCPALEQGDEK